MPYLIALPRRHADPCSRASARARCANAIRHAVETESLAVCETELVTRLAVETGKLAVREAGLEAVQQKYRQAKRRINARRVRLGDKEDELWDKERCTDDAHHNGVQSDAHSRRSAPLRARVKARR